MRVYTHVAAEVGQRSPFRADSVTTDHVLKLRPVARLDPLELCSLRLNHVKDALAPGERFRRANNGPRLHKYRDQLRAVLLGEYAGELEDACSLGPPIDEDHDFREFSNALVSPQECRLVRLIPRRLLGHGYSSPPSFRLS